MKYTLLLFCSVLALFFIASCKQDPKGAGNAEQTESTFASPTQLAGHWIAIDFCSRANQYGSALAAMTYAHLPYAYALTFDPNRPDSVICYNGFETWSLPVRYNQDTLELVGARQGKSVYLLYSSQTSKEITMFDATTGSVNMDRFIKSKAGSQNGADAFMTALNHNLFSGIFHAIGKGATKGDIMFMTSGQIRNWAPYDRYTVCSNGDCFVSGNEIDVITLSKSDSEEAGKLFGFRYNATNDTLSLFNLVDQNPEEKGAYAIKGVAYKFVRVPSQK